MIKRIARSFMLLLLLLGGKAYAQSVTAHSVYNSTVDQINCETIRFIHREAGRGSVADKTDCSSYEAIAKSIPADESKTTLALAKAIDKYKTKYNDNKPLDAQLEQVISYADKRIEAKPRKGDVAAFLARLEKLKTDAIANMNATAAEEPAATGQDQNQDVLDGDADTTDLLTVPETAEAQPVNWMSFAALVLSIAALLIGIYLLIKSFRTPAVAFENKNEEKLWRKKVLEESWEERFNELEARFQEEIAALKQQYEDNLATVTASTGYTEPEYTDQAETRDTPPVPASPSSSPSSWYANAASQQPYTPAAPATVPEEEEEETLSDDAQETGEEELSPEEEAWKSEPAEERFTLVYEEEEEDESTDDEYERDEEQAEEDEPETAARQEPLNAYTEPVAEEEPEAEEEDNDEEEEDIAYYKEEPAANAGEDQEEEEIIIEEYEEEITGPYEEEPAAEQGTSDEPTPGDEEEIDEDLQFTTYIKPFAPEADVSGSGNADEDEGEGLPYYMYAGVPDPDGSFSADAFTELPGPDSVYEVELYDEVPNKAFFSLLPYPETVERVLSDPDHYLAPCCTYSDSPQGKEIIVLVDEGQLRKQDDRWEVARKATIRFE